MRAALIPRKSEPPLIKDKGCGGKRGKEGRRRSGWEEARKVRHEEDREKEVLKAGTVVAEYRLLFIFVRNYRRVCRVSTCS